MKKMLGTMLLAAGTLMSSCDDNKGNIDGTKKHTNQSIRQSIETVKQNNSYETIGETAVYKEKKIHSGKIISIPTGIVLKNLKKENEERSSIEIHGETGRINNKYLKDKITKQMLETEKGAIVNKKERKIFIYSNFGEKLEFECKIALGRNADGGAKTEEGDGKTPTGKYKIGYKNNVSQYGEDPVTGGSLGSLLISYPSKQDIVQGYIGGILQKHEYNRLVKSKKLAPEQNTNLGGNVMIHGGGSNRDRTAGCVGLSNEDQVKILKYLPVGSDIIITD